MSRRVAARDNSRYGAAATAAPVLTASARSRRRRVKVFSQVFFKKLARCGAELHGPKGVARTVGPAFPYSQKRGTDVPLLGWHRARASPYALRGLACRLGCCLPVADAQHRPKWQRRPALNGAHRAPAPCGRCPAFLPPAAPVKAVERCSTPASRLPPRSAAGQR